MTDYRTDTLQSLVGTVERLTFQNEENGYTVARLVPKGQSYEVTAVGNLAGVQVGESVHLRGVWTTHAKYGRQFEIQSYTVQLPATVEGLRKYLGSGMIKGVGPVNAGRIVDHFGLETLDIIEAEPERLQEVPGVGAKRAKWVAQAWEEQKHIKELMLFLQGHGVSTGLAVKIYKQYGDAAIGVVRSDPYRLVQDIYGVGFKTADKIARKLGLASDAPARIQAGLRYVLRTFSDDGHCFAAQKALIAGATKLLGVPPDACTAQLAALIQAEDLVADAGLEQALDGPSDPEQVEDERAIYLPRFYYSELGVANKLRALHTAGRDRLAVFQDVDWERAFAWLDARAAASAQAFQLAEQQRLAVRMALTHKVSILTGGPGTGKSTITGSIIDLLLAKDCSVLLAAPTGRAAKRLSEATGLEAKTIHRLLEFKPSLGNRFLRDRENPLDADMIIVDEASMVDIMLMHQLLKAVGMSSHLLLVGDVDQLPSVGPGNVLRDLIDSDVLPVTRLETIFRQAADSFIILNAHRINAGKLPVFWPTASDVFLFPQSEPEKAAALLLDLVAQRIPEKFGYDPGQDIQVLSPMHRGAVGVTALNHALQARLNPPSPDKGELVLGRQVLRVGDRVMQVRNDYERQVFNGDMGWVVALDPEDQTMVVDFGGLFQSAGAPVSYEFAELGHSASASPLVHAYAVSIHKSQGAEFPAVVIPLLTQHYMMLQRNLLYTAVTRAREIVVLVGDRRAVAIAVRNNAIAHRNTRLAHRLQRPPARPSDTLTY